MINYLRDLISKSKEGDKYGEFSAHSSIKFLHKYTL